MDSCRTWAAEGTGRMLSCPRSASPRLEKGSLRIDFPEHSPKSKNHNHLRTEFRTVEPRFAIQLQDDMLQSVH